MVRHGLASHQPQRSPTPSAYRAGDEGSRWGKVQTLQRLLIPRNRVSPKEAFEGLELCERKLSCTVLRGLDGSNPVRLLGDTSRIAGNPLRNAR